MQKRCLLGTVIFSMSAWATVGLSRDVVQQQHQQHHPRSFSSLDELKRKCSEAESNTQIQPFLSTFECSAQETFWAPAGTKRFRLPNVADISFMALMKDGRHQSKWSDVPGESHDEWGFCGVYEQFSASLSHAVTLHSCAELNQITDEHTYCAEKLAASWDECHQEQADAIAKGHFEIPAASRCTYEKTGNVRSCTGDDYQPAQQCRQQQHQGPVAQAPVQVGRHHQHQQCVDVEPMVSEFEVGADIAPITVKYSHLHGSHKSILINSEVREGGMLAAIGLVQGDVVARINSRRTRSVDDFLKLLAKAKASGKVRIEYRNTDGKWVTVRRDFL